MQSWSERTIKISADTLNSKDTYSTFNIILKIKAFQFDVGGRFYANTIKELPLRPWRSLNSHWMGFTFCLTVTMSFLPFLIPNATPYISLYIYLHNGATWTVFWLRKKIIIVIISTISKCFLLEFCRFNSEIKTLS